MAQDDETEIIIQDVKSYASLCDPENSDFEDSETKFATWEKNNRECNIQNGEMTQSDENEILIEVVKRFPFLYNVEHPDSKNAQKKLQTWEKIAHECNIQDGKSAKKKWRNLCGYYKKILNKEKQDKVKRSKWMYRDQMAFITDSVECARNESPNSHEFSMSDSDISEDEQEVNTENKRLKNERQTVDKMIIQYLQKKSQEKKEDMDSLGHFFKSMECIVRTFSHNRQIEMKYKLSAIIFGAESQELKEKMGVSNSNNFHPIGPPANAFLSNPSNFMTSHRMPNTFYPPSSSSCNQNIFPVSHPPTLPTQLNIMNHQPSVQNKRK